MMIVLRRNHDVSLALAYELCQLVERRRRAPARVGKVGLAEQRQVCVDGVDNLHCMATSQQRSLAPATDPHTYTRRPWWTFDASTTLEEEHSQSSHRLRLLPHVYGTGMHVAKFIGPRRFPTKLLRASPAHARAGVPPGVFLPVRNRVVARSSGDTHEF